MTYPTKKGNGLLAGGGGLLLIVVFLVTGFLAPGFLVSDGKPKTPGSPPLDLNAGSIAAGQFILAVLGDDEAQAREASCASTAETIVESVKLLGSENAHLTAGTPVQTGPNEMSVPLEGNVGSRPVEGALRVRRTEGAYCISGVTTPH
ncbi:hypothetical protein H4696_005529 [Amycolatopsis lexingtonensis]|uniref:Uncharacterized protein n=1 Tax=Amycolatopsis lexingtonensis TaxID=218822 RepID=A0ABR9I5I7_9PSEU|nr:hypothetical protein [Amycolatopsis lexingtonensis]MBE1498429.1 hypothetical protein [Amycolatopsis lexingtonensis]